jgi:hypothetical protein
MTAKTQHPAHAGNTVPREIKTNSQAYRDLIQHAFSQICNPRDWKAPVDCVVPYAHASMFYDAIVSITGTVPTSERTIDGHMRMTAIGYRNGPCGDH